MIQIISQLLPSNFTIIHSHFFSIFLDATE